MRRFLLACGLSLFALVAHANTAEPVAPDQALEERVMALSHKLRCLVCQNQSIAESDADLAVDLRGQVREQLSAGKNEDEIADYMVARYGDFVLYEPPMRGSTLLLWLGPLVLAVVGIGVLMLRLSRRNKESAPVLNEAQRAKARALLEKDDNNGTQA
ncbi:cytochrome c-type biogenesis protein [Denitromonas halophila]|uniref:Cytochrome c-type biogenesis protein n=1 Tax=Denitromonas halophila TaxID=1629404 RepID=A0A557R0L2_9RHOO|nr:cytochrome c-type biogenesis protein [Denitromonas halophila]TVO58674.1 cytochrome c-type biogenesis protein CcmH [Denitromonas halophila]